MVNIIENSLNQDFCGERLLATLIQELNNMRDVYDVSDCVKLGEKLLSHDYYKESNAFLVYMCRDDSKLSNLEAAIYSELRLKDYKRKQADYEKFFYLLRTKIEEWC